MNSYDFALWLVFYCRLFKWKKHKFITSIYPKRNMGIESGGDGVLPIDLIVTWFTVVIYDISHVKSVMRLSDWGIET